jgi:SAM-dependent methyltransferase
MVTTGTLRAMDDWRSYDRTATVYERVHAPRFAEPARDLATLAGVGVGTRVLDVGTGTGIGAEVARDLGAEVIGIDPSVGMLDARAARPEIGGGCHQAIDLPFPNGRLTSCQFRARALRQGRNGPVRAYARRAFRGDRVHAGPTSRAFTDAWRELVSTVVPDDMLGPTLAKAIPNHERFTRRSAVERPCTTPVAPRADGARTP